MFNNKYLIFLLFLLGNISLAQSGSEMLTLGVGRGVSSGGGGASIVQVRNCGNFASSITCPTSSNITNGNVLVAMIFFQGGIGGLPSVPSGCVTWTQVATSVISTNTMIWATGPVTATGGCTASLTTSGPNGQISMILWECSGCLTTTEGTASFTHSGTGGTPISGPSITTSTNNDMVFAGLITNNTASEALTLNSPYTTDNAGLDNNNAFYNVMGHIVLTPAGTTNAVYTNTVGSSSMYMGIMALKP